MATREKIEERREEEKPKSLEIKFKYVDYLHLPNDGKRYQIIGGELYVVPAPMPYHQDISRNLEFILYSFVKERELGRVYYAPCDVVLSEEDVVQPDILFILKEREHIIGKKNVQGAPDLIIEILSPRTMEIDRKLKVKLYERYGVKEYWLVEPERKEVEVLVLAQQGYTSLGTFKKSFPSPLLKTKVDLRDVF
jgi:Uma2 family endonuclease